LVLLDKKEECLEEPCTYSLEFPKGTWKKRTQLLAESRSGGGGPYTPFPLRRGYTSRTKRGGIGTRKSCHAHTAQEGRYWSFVLFTNKPRAALARGKILGGLRRMMGGVSDQRGGEGEGAERSLLGGLARPTGALVDLH